MKTVTMIVAVMISLSVCSFANGPKEPQKAGMSYLLAKNHAEAHSMKYVLYFKADWCMPCQWMEETTFQDETIQASVDNLFILVPLDIDEFEGFALKEYFQVYTLPTMLVFNEKHEIINRNEGSLSPSGLLSLIANENAQASSSALNGDNPVVNNAPKIQQPEAAPVVDKTHSEPNSLNDQPVLQESLSPSIIESVSRYSVQLGAFSSYENAKIIQQKANQYTTEPVEISSIAKGDAFIYKVYAGKLHTESEATQLKNTLSSYGMNGFVKSVVLGSKS